MMAIPNNVFVLSAFFLSLFSILYAIVLSPNDDIAIIRQRILQQTIWPAPENISTTVQNALSDSHSLNSSCYWPDIDYSDEHIVVWSTATHMYRITTMLQALTINGSTIQNDPEIMAKVHCALNVWFMHDWQNPNWWFNQIDIPLQATGQLLMLGDNATSLEIEKIKEISYRAAWWLNRSQDVGTNLVWMIQCQMYRSLATFNRTGIEQGFSRMWQDVIISPLGGEGVQFDWSYHFHGYQLMSGSYGNFWAENILLFIQCSQNTQYQPDDQTLSIFANFLAKGDAWMLMTDAWDWHVVGRDVGSPGNGFRNKLTPNWIRSVAQLVKSNETKIELLNFANRFDNQPNASLLVGNKHFFISDYQVHRRLNYIFTIKMQSIRTQPVECINGQNQKDEHGGQGVLNLYRVGFNDYYNLFGIIDWQAINGITVEHDIPLEPCKGGKFDLIPLSFVGGVSDGQYGLAMMDTASHNLTAKRSWHFYDNAVIALATNLTLRTSTTVWTTLASRLLRTGQITVGFFNSTIINLNNGNYSFPYVHGATSNVQWIHVTESNITYVLQLQQQYASLVIQLGTKTGNYDAVGPFYFIVTARMLTVYIDHGIGPYTLDYYYMILPNISRELIPALIRQYNKEQVFACTSTNNSFHGTMWPSLKHASFVLWDNITATFSCRSPLFEINIQLSDAGAYLFSETETDFTLTASHPVRVNGTVNVVVDRVGRGEGCTVPRSTDARTTNVTLMLPSLPEYLGASVNVTCKK
jgi:chondroitin AC lyase